MIAAEYLGEMGTAWSAGAVKGGSIHMLMVAVHFVTFPVGGHTTEPQAPLRFISQIYSVLQHLGLRTNTFLLVCVSGSVHRPYLRTGNHILSIRFF